VEEKRGHLGTKPNRLTEPSETVFPLTGLRGQGPRSLLTRLGGTEEKAAILPDIQRQRKRGLGGPEKERPRLQGRKPEKEKSQRQFLKGRGFPQEKNCHRPRVDVRGKETKKRKRSR